MPIPQMPGTGLSSLDDVINYVTRLERELRFLMESGLDSTNMFEVGGWRVTPSQIASLDNSVGMSSLETGADDVRFFAGTKFKVTKSGILYAVDGNFSGNITGSTITGGTIRTAGSGNARIELSGGRFTGYNETNQKTGLYFDINAVPGTGIADVGLYHNDTLLAQFYDELTNFALIPKTSAGFAIGGSAGPITGRGNWIFSGSVDLGVNTASGKVQYAGQADSALSASSASSVDWANVTNHPDATTLPVVDGTAAIGASAKYAKADHVHPTDTSRAPIASPTFTGTPAAPTPATNDSSTKLATTAFANPGSSIATPGYQKLPSGLIMQWGIIQVASGATITFPLAFPNNCFSVVLTPGGGTAITSGASNLSKTNFIAQHGNGATATYVQWMAMGN